MDYINNLVPIRKFCENRPWPTVQMVNHWIHSKKLIARKCVKKIQGRYFIDTKELENFLRNATLEETEE